MHEWIYTNQLQEHFLIKEIENEPVFLFNTLYPAIILCTLFRKVISSLANLVFFLLKLLGKLFQNCSLQCITSQSKEQFRNILDSPLNNFNNSSFQSSSEKCLEAERQQRGGSGRHAALSCTATNSGKPSQFPQTVHVNSLRRQQRGLFYGQR